MTLGTFTFNVYALIFAIASTGLFVTFMNWVIPKYRTKVTTHPEVIERPRDAKDLLIFHAATSIRDSAKKGARANLQRGNYR